MSVFCYSQHEFVYGFLATNVNFLPGKTSKLWCFINGCQYSNFGIFLPWLGTPVGHSWVGPGLVLSNDDSLSSFGDWCVRLWPSKPTRETMNINFLFSIDTWFWPSKLYFYDIVTFSQNKLIIHSFTVFWMYDLLRICSGFLPDGIMEWK